MAKSIDRIDRQITELEQAVATLADELHTTYLSYLTALGQAVCQQLVLASYHICTQGYPSAFLKLSFSERQKLQEALREAARLAAQQLVDRLEAPTVKAVPELPLPKVGFPELLDLELSETSKPFEPFFLSTEVTTEVSESLDLPLDTWPASPEPSANLPDPVAEPAPEPEPVLQKITNPQLLKTWQERVERSIVETLQTSSHQANLLLQKAGILPKKLPEPVLEAAARADAGGEAIGGAPNLLNLLIEAGGSEDSSGKTIAQLVAIHLRLGEIEFADSSLSPWRSQLRQLLAKLSKLERDYQKKQRERTVAQAEAAWKASWLDE
jgi:hypothetical protein